MFLFGLATQTPDAPVAWGSSVPVDTIVVEVAGLKLVWEATSDHVRSSYNNWCDPD